MTYIILHKLFSTHFLFKEKECWAHAIDAIDKMYQGNKTTNTNLKCFFLNINVVEH